MMGYPFYGQAASIHSTLQDSNVPQHMRLANSASQSRYPPMPGLVEASQLTHTAVSPAVVPCFKPIPSLFVLLIGINAYQNPQFPPLRGAEPDACAFKEYFERCLSVPSSHITLLLGSNATRTRIIEAFKNLAGDRRINRGDPIVIFYAGHGGQIIRHDLVQGRSRETLIEMLVPYDCSPEVGQSSIPAIPDHTIGALIGQIAEEKGDNITVIFDCCHSASGTRSLPNLSRVRAVYLDNSMYKPSTDASLHQPAATSRAVRPAPQYPHGALNSHVLLAACRSSEKALEFNGRGNFSAALLKLLRSTPPDDLTYRDILSRMDTISQQNPQCEGIHRNRYLFSNKVATPGFKAGLEHLFDASGKVKLMASVVNALIPGSRPQPLSQNYPRRKEDLVLYIPPNDPSQHLFERVCFTPGIGRDLASYNVSLEANPFSAHLGACMHPSGQRITLNVLDQRATQYGFKGVFEISSIEPESVAPVLSSAAHFFRVLRCSSSSTGVGKQIDVQFNQLEEASRCSETGEINFKPMGPNLYNRDLGQIELDVVDGSTPYGFTLVNNGPQRFYAYLFYFDFSDLSIVPFYEPPAAQQKYQTDFSLGKKGGTLSIGYGSGGVAPLSFQMGKDQDVEVGYFKLFISTKPVDLSSIPQGSPFATSRRAMKTYERKGSELWDDILIPLVLRRR